jgi:ureidoacrylate peracid hydrolase
MATSATTASVATQQGEVQIELNQSAVIVVDMQNDFGHPDGMFGRAGVDISGMQAAVAPTAAVLAAARQAGLMVVYLKMAYRADLSDAGVPGGPIRVKQAPMGIGEQIPAPDGTTGRLMIRDTWNTDIVDGLTPEPGEAVIYKHRFSGFYETALHELLQRWHIKYLVFTGGTTSVCVESTMRDAAFRDYYCLLLEDCTAEPIGQTNHDASLNLLGRVFGWTCHSEALLAALKQPAAAPALEPR